MLESETWTEQLEDLDDDLFDGFPEATVAVRKTYDKMLKEIFDVLERPPQTY